MYTLQFIHHQLTSAGNCKLHLLTISTPFECDSYFPFLQLYTVCWIAHNLFIQLKRHKEREENMERGEKNVMKNKKKIISIFNLHISRENQEFKH